MKHGVVMATGAGCFLAGILIGWQVLPRTGANGAATDADSARAGSGRSGPSLVRGSGSRAAPSRTASSGSRSSRGSSGPTPSVDEILRLTVATSQARTYQNLSALLDGLDAGQFESLIEEMRGNWSDPQVQVALGAVFEKFGETAPRDLIAFMQDARDNRLPYGNALNAAANALVAEAPDEALDLFLNLKGPDRNSTLNSLLNAASTLKPELLPEWFAHPEVQKVLKNRYSSWVVQNALKNWARSDPETAAAYAASVENGVQKQQMMNAVAGAWAGSDMAAALEWVDGIENSTLRRTARNSIATALAGRDPRAALQLLDETSSKSDRQTLLSAISGAWTGRDLDGLHDWFLELEDPVERATAIRGATGKIAANPERFLDLLADVPKNKRIQISSNIVNQWVHQDPDAATEWVLGLEKGPERTSTLQSLISQLGHSNPSVAAEIFDSMGDEVPASMRYTVSNIAGSWARNDPEAALSWATGIGDAEMKRRAMQGAVSNWVQVDPESASAYVMEEVKDKKTRDATITSMLSNWMHQDDEAARAWARTLPDEERLKAGAAIVQGFINKNSLEGAMVEFSSIIAEFPEALEESQFKNSSTQLMYKIAETEPERAIAVYDQLPESSARANAAGGIVDAWLKKDSIAASEWVGNLPEGKARDAGAIKIINKIVGNDAEGAFHWAVSLSSSGQRRSYATRAVASLAKSDLNAAVDLITTSGLSEDEQNNLLTTLKKQK